MALINEAGGAFDPETLQAVRAHLDALSDPDREAYRNANAQAIASLPAGRILIVSGPGTGKSHLFKERIKYWLRNAPDASVLAVSFVRKLVADLGSDIQNDLQLTDVQKRQIVVSTLHRYARSLVERNRGTAQWRFSPHFSIIAPRWKDLVWHDTLRVTAMDEPQAYTIAAFEHQLHEDRFDATGAWPALRDSYFRVCQLYSAAGFSDLILRARDALAENPQLSDSQYFIFDEYQDFNAAEESLLVTLTQHSNGVLIVGDDDQVLYERLKAGKPGLIRGLYRGGTHVTAMLPFCGRSDLHIARVAGHFIQQHPAEGSIEKIYLPLKTDAAALKVRVVACPAPGSAIDYIREFLATHADEIAQRMNALADRQEKDAFLLILSPSREMKFLGASAAALWDLIAKYQNAAPEFSDDYYKVLTYYSLSRFPNNNFTFRKVLDFEDIPEPLVHSLIQECLATGHAFAALGNPVVPTILQKCEAVRVILAFDRSAEEKVADLQGLIRIERPEPLLADLKRHETEDAALDALEHQDEEQAELAELLVRPMAAVEIMPIVRSKGLSADHVVIIGCDETNMAYVTRNAFYVGLTRARKSLDLLTVLKAGGSKGMHEYVDDLPEAHMEFYKHTKSKQTKRFNSKRDCANFLQWLNEQYRKK